MTNDEIIEILQGYYQERLLAHSDTKDEIEKAKIFGTLMGLKSALGLLEACREFNGR